MGNRSGGLRGPTGATVPLHLRRRLYLGASWRRHASGVTTQVSARRRGEAGEDWLWKIIQRKKPKQAAIALANRMARTAYALMKNKTEDSVHGRGVRAPTFGKA